uniref:Fungal-type protein kinase domain-containing protein n=1 Tax=Schizophyllum commune (strain H4-8 / FGSC 9210) TaxID=578458 RepID=D8QAJ3_SCHCM
MATPTNIINVSMADFYNIYLKGWGRIGEESMQCLMQHLIEEEIYQQDHWRDFPGAKAYASDVHRAHIWNPMQRVFADVVQAAATVLGASSSMEKRCATFECAHGSETFAENLEIEQSFAVDGWTELAIPSKRGKKPGCAYEMHIGDPHDRKALWVRAADVGITARWERRGSKKTRMQNEYNTIGAASHILSTDRRRAFHVSITMEDTIARLWYHSRSFSVVSEPFDVNKCPAELIQFILFSTYAKDAQLGLDEHIARVLDREDRLQYQYVVRPNPNDHRCIIYQTVDVLAPESPHDASPALHDSGVVVWCVQPAKHWKDGRSVPEGAPFHALKDFAQLEDRPREWELQAKVRRAMRKVAQSPEELRAMRMSLVTIMADGPMALTEQNEVPEGVDVYFKRRRRSVTVYKEVCVDLYKLEDPSVQFFALSKVAEILSWWKRIGVVHRDPSPGNFLVQLPDHEDAGIHECIVKITDLESMQFYDDLGPWDCYTGTDYYMAIEAQAGRHLFCPPDVPPSLLALNHYNHSPYNDLEPILWMALDYVTKRADGHLIGDSPSASLLASLRYQLAYRDLIFTTYTGSETRTRLMQGDPTECEMLRATLVRTYGARSPVPHLVDLIYAMAKAYRHAQRSAIDEELEAGVPREGVAHKRLPLKCFRSWIYQEIEKGLAAISRYYETLGSSLMRLEDLDLDALSRKCAATIQVPELAPALTTEGELAAAVVETPADTTGQATIYANEKDCQSAVHSSVAREVLETDRTVHASHSASSAMKRKAGDEVEDSIEAKRPCSVLSTIKIYAAPGENEKELSDGSKLEMVSTSRVQVNTRPAWR